VCTSDGILQRVGVDLRSRPFAAAGALFLDEGGGVLIVEPTYKAVWEIPGGAVEHGESPREACARELREELGFEVRPGRLLVVDWSSNMAGGDRVRFVFDGGVLSDVVLDSIVLPPHELGAWACVPEQELGAVLAPDLTRRVTAARGARAAGETWYLENGIPEHALR
jgi:8-oxo-dGTP pyrophosphatase MutT (NUDIX family)